MGLFDRLKKEREEKNAHRDVRCHKCQTTWAQVKKNKKDLRRQMERQFGKDTMFIGFGGGHVAMGFLKCPKCGKISCSKCALELPGHSEKSCPSCREDYVWGSVID